MLEELEGILLSTSWAVVRALFGAKSSALKMDSGVAVSETRRLMEEPVTSTRCMLLVSLASCASTCWLSRLAARPLAQIKRWNGTGVFL